MDRMDQNQNVVQSEFYNTYKDHTVMPEFIIAASIFLVEASLGIFGNINIIYATIFNKSLHGSCNILLAIASFADTLNLLSPFIFAGHVYSGKNFVPLPTCFWYYALSLYGTMLGVETVLIIAFDRLLGVIIPNVYRLINKWIYIGTTMFAAMAYAGWGLYEIYKLAVVQPNRMVIPFVGEAEHDFLMIFFSNIVMFNLITLLCYFAIWIILKMRKNLRDTSMKKIVKSLIMISLVVFFGWTVCSAVQLIIGFVFHMPEIPFTFLNVYFGVTVHGSLSVNYVILYKFSKDYRKALRKQLNDLCWFVARKNGVHDISITNVTEVKMSKFVTNAEK